MNLLPLSLAAVVSVAGVVAQDAAPTSPPRVAAAHAAHCERLYAECASAATQLLRRVEELLAHPDAEHLAAAREAWCVARRSYGQSEALRFHDGPIDAVEPLLNAWPVDESYIESTLAGGRLGIVQDTTTYRSLAVEVLEHANERGSETNISVGWHAIEFLLWGVDRSASGPGDRPASDFDPTAGPIAERRRTYLLVATGALCIHLDGLRTAWSDRERAFRRRFVADPQDALRRMLTGALILTAFELAGERLAVAYETQNQEQEHSCFSDTTCADLEANQLGILAVLGIDEKTDLPDGIVALLRTRDAAIADHLARCARTTLAALRAIPAPFDQAFVGDDTAAGRVAIGAAIDALDAQAEALAIAGQLLGFELPVRPGN